MPTSVKRLTNTGESCSVYDPTPTALTHFAVPAFSLNPSPGISHLSPSLFYHNILFSSVGTYISVKVFLLLLLPLTFHFLPHWWHNCLLGQCTCMWPFRYQRHSPFVTTCCGLVWKLGVEKGREHVLMGGYSSLVLYFRTNFVFMSLHTSSVQGHGRSCSPGLKWCSVQLRKKKLVWYRNWNYLMFDQPKAIFFSPDVHHCQRKMGLMQSLVTEPFAKVCFTLVLKYSG